MPHPTSPNRLLKLPDDISCKIFEAVSDGSNVLLRGVCRDLRTCVCRAAVRSLRIRRPPFALPLTPGKLKEMVMQCSRLRRLAVEFPDWDRNNEAVFGLALEALDALHATRGQTAGISSAPLAEGLTEFSLISSDSEPARALLLGLRAPLLRNLDLSHSQLESCGAELSDAFRRMPLLHKLVLNDTGLDQSACEAIGGAPESLRVLEVVGAQSCSSCNDLGVEDCLLLVGSFSRLLPRLTSARLTVLPGLSVSAAGSLLELELLGSRSWPRTDWSGVLEGIGALTDIESLCISDRACRQFPADGLEAIGGLMGLTRLEVTGQKTAATLAHVPSWVGSLTAMRKLHLTGIGSETVTETGPPPAALLSLTQLTDLLLEDSRITGSAFCTLSFSRCVRYWIGGGSQRVAVFVKGLSVPLLGLACWVTWNLMWIVHAALPRFASAAATWDPRAPRLLRPPSSPPGRRRWRCWT